MSKHLIPFQTKLNNLSNVYKNFGTDYDNPQAVFHALKVVSTFKDQANQLENDIIDYLGTLPSHKQINDARSLFIQVFKETYTNFISQYNSHKRLLLQRHPIYDTRYVDQEINKIHNDREDLVLKFPKSKEEFKPKVEEPKNPVIQPIQPNKFASSICSFETNSVDQEINQLQNDNKPFVLQFPNYEPESKSNIKEPKNTLNQPDKFAPYTPNKSSPTQEQEIKPKVDDIKNPVNPQNKFAPYTPNKSSPTQENKVEEPKNTVIQLIQQNKFAPYTPRESSPSQEQINLARNEYERLTKLNAELQNNNNILTQKNAQLQQYFNELNQKNLFLTQNIQKLDQEYSNFHNDNQSLDERYQCLQKSIREQTKKLESLKKQVADYTNQYTLLEDKIFDKEAKLNSLNRKIQELPTSINSLEIAHKQKSQSLRIVENQLKDKQAELSHITKKINEKNLQLSNLDSQIKEMKSNIDKHDSALSQIKLENNHYQKEIQKNIVIINNNKNIINQLQSDINEKQAIIADLERKINEKKNLFNETSSQYIDLYEKLVTVQNEIKEIPKYLMISKDNLINELKNEIINNINLQAKNKLKKDNTFRNRVIQRMDKTIPEQIQRIESVIHRYKMMHNDMEKKCHEYQRNIKACKEYIEKNRDVVEEIMKNKQTLNSLNSDIENKKDEINQLNDLLQEANQHYQNELDQFDRIMYKNKQYLDFYGSIEDFKNDFRNLIVSICKLCRLDQITFKPSIQNDTFEFVSYQIKTANDKFWNMYSKYFALLPNSKQLQQDKQNGISSLFGYVSSWFSQPPEQNHPQQKNNSLNYRRQIQIINILPRPSFYYIFDNYQDDFYKNYYYENQFNNEKVPIDRVMQIFNNENDEEYNSQKSNEKSVSQNEHRSLTVSIPKIFEINLNNLPEISTNEDDFDDNSHKFNQENSKDEENNEEEDDDNIANLLRQSLGNDMIMDGLE